jgi:hypothetical protein
MEKLTPYERVRIWRMNNKDRLKEQAKRYHLKHKEHLLQYWNDYYQNQNENHYCSDCCYETTKRKLILRHYNSQKHLKNTLPVNV